MITIFTAPKAFEGHIGLIQRNAIRSWIQLGDEVEVLLVGDEIGIAETAAEFNLRWLEVQDRNPHGTPLLSAIFGEATSAAETELMCYVNSDIIFFSDFILGVNRARTIGDRFLVVGQRWDLSVDQPIEFSESWEVDLWNQFERRGRRHRRTGSDYFVYPKRCLENIPPFALGRAGWDNWMIYNARRKEIPVIDASDSITVVHQDHDYAHLPDAQPHYRLPETDENVRLAGGRRHMFTLDDADWVLLPGDAPGPKRRKRSIRLIESSLQLNARSRAVTEIIFAFFHPMRALRQWIGILRGRIEGIRAG